MKTIKVYRFERNGIGPYLTNSSSFKTERLQNLHYRFIDKMVYNCDENSHPNITEDLYIFPTKEMYCGCLSIAELKLWFKGVLSILKQLNFKIVEYNIPENNVYYTQSNKQIVFLKNN